MAVIVVNLMLLFYGLAALLLTHEHRSDSAEYNQLIQKISDAEGVPVQWSTNTVNNWRWESNRFEYVDNSPWVCVVVFSSTNASGPFKTKELEKLITNVPPGGLFFKTEVWKVLR